ncbi:neurogenic locus notch homolog protein 1-like [Saccostrea echinata]|uniref:neurogenic locus notch homolog protein 1-like n=1 Tax=Saccostrea echinata TaxID=191078 RepID=UPI002A82602D|nr:neurogenic locus notch homolog protein 1-like [Saccostrea echinata]
MAPLIVWFSVLGAVTAQSCQVHSDTFETDFCQMKAAVDVLKGDTQRISNNEVELSKLWHTIRAETKSIYDNRKMIDVIKRNLTDLSIAPNTNPDVMEKLHNITSTVDDKMKNLTDTVTALESRMRQLEIKCSSCGTRGHPCDLHPCENGGKCVELGKDFYCACPLGFAGKLCDVTDHCIPSPCLNNGTCVNNVVSHTCLCSLPYTGPNCTIELTVCDTNPCARGMCVPDGKNFKCLCDPGFYGDLCNSVVDLSLITTASSTLPPKSTPSTLPSKSTTSTLPPKSTPSTLPTKSTNSTLPSKSTISKLTPKTTLSTLPQKGTPKSTINPTNSTVQNSTKPSSQATKSSLPPGTNITTAADPCVTPSICNEPSVCVARGVNYECVCPQTNKTINDACLEPILVKPFDICCIQDICQPISQPIC